MATATEAQPIISPKSYGVAVSLSAVFGLIGIQHFYLGRYILGLTDVSLSVGAVYFIYFAGDDTRLLILGLVCFLLDFLHTLFTTYSLFTGSFKDGRGRLVTYPGQFNQ
jgi:hypothetical protein